MRLLLEPAGCPWDQEQTLASLRQYVIEEAEEVVAAVDKLLDVEARMRQQQGLPPADPSPPPQFTTAHQDKGRCQAHHPARHDFNQCSSASGAPLDKSELPADLRSQWDDARRQLVAELGDLLLQPVFQGELGAKMGYFTLTDIIESIRGKLIRRHPHVFGSTEVNSAEEVLDNWEEIKSKEKAGEER